MDRLNLIGTEGRITAARRITAAFHSTLAVSTTGRKLMVLGASLLVLAVAALWWATRAPAQAVYRLATVTSGAVSRTVTATGTVNPVLTIIVGSYVSGVISSTSCDYNTRVRKGQVCAKIDPRPYQAALDQAKGQLARDSAQLQGARVNLARYAELKGEDSIERQTYEDQVALVHQLEGSVQVDRAALQTARVNLGYTSIVSPVDGTVVARNITIGQTVAASFQTPTLFLIATDLTRMQVDTNVSESDIGALKEGNPATFTVEAFADRAFHGTVVQVRQAPQTVQNVVTYDVVVGADNGQFLLKPGMTATVTIVSERRDKALRIPNQALRFTPGGVRAVQPGPTQAAAGAPAGAQVWILRSGQPAAVNITTGLADDTYTEVLAGELHAGDQVVVGEQPAAGSSRTRGLHFGL